MKYMGSKRAMLGNGLGELLGREVTHARRFVDLFAGSGAVAVHVAQRFAIPVLAFDLQRYSAILAGAVIARQSIIKWKPTFEAWQKRAESLFKAYDVPSADCLTVKLVTQLRSWCEAQVELPITTAYGGHYFSPRQAVWIDAFRATLPKTESSRTVALAALIQASSQCAAAPGHTAQPFQPTRTAKRFLSEAWCKDIVGRTRTVFEIIADQHAQRGGRAQVPDANDAAQQLKDCDLAFIDPPYSGVHYSRFYHVLETIADGNCGEVSGTGRYPTRIRRPRSRFSVGSESADALDGLLSAVSSRGARAIVTFPDHDCSNGLSGDSVREIAARHFHVYEQGVESKFSTLGGTSDQGRPGEGGRSARRLAKELILVLKPK